MADEATFFCTTRLDRIGTWAWKNRVSGGRADSGVWWGGQNRLEEAAGLLLCSHSHVKTMYNEDEKQLYYEGQVSSTVIGDEIIVDIYISVKRLLMFKDGNNIKYPSRILIITLNNYS